MPIRPRDLVDRTRPDNTQYVSQVGRSNGVSSFTTQDGESLRFFSAFFHPASVEYPWANPPLQPGERVFLSRSSKESVEQGTVGQPLSFSNPLVLGEGIDFEVVQDYVDMRGDVEMVLWGTKPSAEPPYNSEDQFEPIGPIFYDGQAGAFNVQRVAEPTARSTFDINLEGTQAVAATIENRSGNSDPIRGKVYIACVIRRPVE